MKTEKLLIIGGLAFLGFFIYKKYKKPKATIVEPKVEEDKVTQDMKTIVLDLRQKPMQTKRQKFLESFQKGYDARQGSTIAPPMVTIKPFVNDL